MRIGRKELTTLVFLVTTHDKENVDWKNHELLHKEKAKAV